jgi:hypothetical protein
MKNILLIILVSFAFVPSIAQQNPIKWKGTLKLDSPTDIILNFKNGTCEAVRVADSQSIEIMNYTLNDTLLTLQKVSGDSDCDTTSIGKYKIEKKNNSLLVTLISDDCDDRSNALDNTTWIKQE